LHTERIKVMSKVCQISGKKVQFGNNVSKAINKTRRRFDANIISKKFYIPEENKWIKLKVSTSVLKTINKKGISTVLKEAKEKGIKL
jgi:large subunit ribosomal protein L28